MKLSELLKGVEYEGRIRDCEVCGVCDDTRRLSVGDIFFAIRGSMRNGEEFIDEGLSKGAVCVISESRRDGDNCLKVDNVKSVMKKIVDKFYGHPLKKVRLIGITGTNGKTTTSHIVWNIFNFSGKKCGVIGTLGAKWGDNLVEIENTTPSYIDFCKIVKDMVKDGVGYVVCEVSAHAIDQDRLCGLKFDVGVLTNITQDHLDYFSDMENYKKAKLSFFESGICKYMVVNSDTECGRYLLEKYREKTLSYAIENPADVFGIDFEESGGKQRFVLNVMDEVYFIESSLLGEFNGYNLLAASTVCRLLGIRGESLTEGIKSVKSVDGRYQVYGEKQNVIIDYAHTPDGMENLLKQIGKSGAKIICVFGCGGDRDKAKRPIMGKIAESYSEVVILTEDNSRSENVLDIIDDIRQGMRKTPVVLPNRREAIEYALEIAKNDEKVVILGKGAEKYIEKSGFREYFSDEEEVKKLIATT